MNKESYAALTPSQKTAFDRLTGKELSLKGAKIFDDWSEEAFKAAREGKRVEVIALAPDVRKAMFDAAQPVTREDHRRSRKQRYCRCTDGLSSAEQMRRAGGDATLERTAMIGRALRALTVYSPLHAIDRVVRAVALYCGGAVLGGADDGHHHRRRRPLCLQLAALRLARPRRRAAGARSCPARSGMAEGPARTSPPTW